MIAVFRGAPSLGIRIREVCRLLSEQPEKTHDTRLSLIGGDDPATAS